MRPIIRSQHESHRPIVLKNCTKPIVVNFGNDKPSDKYKDHIYVNPPDAVAKCKNKLRMKELFRQHHISSFTFGKDITRASRFPIVIKSVEHSSGRGLVKINSQEELTKFLVGKEHDKFYYERFYECQREFRVHASRYSQFPFYSTEKVLRERNISWIKNLNSCTFKRDYEPLPKKLAVAIAKDLQAALRVTGMDIAGFDVAICNGKHYVIEMNSACGMATNTRNAYVNQLNKICKLKSNPNAKPSNRRKPKKKVNANAKRLISKLRGHGFVNHDGRLVARVGQKSKASRQSTNPALV